ncbi:glycosyltransferase family 4 protein [Sporolituus thermophilus]|uniref:Glycosyltransferase involved in cell wall bisynthesis n=1 Tax=Sporolituus thermophilus DSM 23256 TaxID=1123285 RepID=A0A1G7NI67_9FIRM|nr:glycosyltransferase family 4 protein [Sporolituus thermophilus]SDF72940.1 Glycosyltransferase involved in cell wall bisynthesis [Sporolituus thermophilus DSM 23256]
MNIVYVSNSIIPSKYANSIHVMKMCNAFSQNSHNVFLLARRGSWLNTRDLHKRYGVTNIFPIIFCWRPNFLPRLWRENIYSTGLCRAVKKLILKDMKPDLLYGRYEHGLFALSKYFDIPFVFETHDTPARSKDVFYVQEALLKQKNLLALVCISDQLKQEYIRVFPWFPKEKIIVVHDGSDLPEETVPGEILDWPGRTGCIQVGYVGHLYPGKGMEIIAQIFRQLPNLDFHIIGGMEKDIEFWKSKCRGSNIFFHGYIWQEKLSSYIKRLDIVLAPFPAQGKYSRWSSPLKIFDYMAWRKPIVASDIPMVREILIDGQNAVLVSPENIDEWIKTLEYLAKDSAYRDNLAQCAYQTLKDKYTWKVRAQNILNSLCL